MWNPNMCMFKIGDTSTNEGHNTNKIPIAIDSIGQPNLDTTLEEEWDIGIYKDHYIC